MLLQRKSIKAQVKDLTEAAVQTGPSPVEEHPLYSVTGLSLRMIEVMF